MENNFYEILNLQKTATSDEIKQSYRNLAKMYHPDKNKNVGATEKFLQIKSAYDILIDNESRRKYDDMNILNKNNFFDLVMGLVKKHSIIAHNHVKNFLESIYRNNDYTNDIDLCKFDKIVEKIMEGLPYLNNDAYNPLNLNIHNENKLDIFEKIECTLEDRYLDKYLYAKIKRNSSDIFKHIPLRNEITTYIGDGEYDDVSKMKGNLIIHVITKKMNGYKFLNSDLFKKVLIDNNTFNNDQILFIHIDGSEFFINKNDILEKYIILKNKGLPKQDHMLDTFERGDLVIEFEIN